MGYKRAGFKHLGGVELDKPIADIYETNHHPRFLFNMDIKDFNRSVIPKELYGVDVLDGSPPCSSFSLSGNREDDWGKEKLFNEGQKLQRLDDLFFDFIDTAAILKPKIIIGENVTGLISGNARAYVNEIIKKFKAIGYDLQLFKLNAASMGVPQKRERVFFICRKKSLRLPRLKLAFNIPPIYFKTIESQVATAIGKPLTDAYRIWWEKCTPGKSLGKVHPKGSFFNSYIIWKNRSVQRYHRL